jgi:tRNA U34 5-methylaminomethyl-2-thiouridine-forming methyltransferase MnmC
VLEVGFGTGLNFLVTSDYCLRQGIALNYTGIEAYPISEEELLSTAYERYVQPEVWNAFYSNYLHAIGSQKTLMSLQKLEIIKLPLVEVMLPGTFHVVYFDAFSLQYQPEMWSNEIIEHAASFLRQGGIFVTYSITGNLKRALKSFGFKIEKLPGAAGKREMLRATKL